MVQLLQDSEIKHQKFNLYSNSELTQKKISLSLETLDQLKYGFKLYKSSAKRSILKSPHKHLVLLKKQQRDKVLHHNLLQLLQNPMPSFQNTHSKQSQAQIYYKLPHLEQLIQFMELNHMIFQDQDQLQEIKQLN